MLIKGTNKKIVKKCNKITWFIKYLYVTIKYKYSNFCIKDVNKYNITSGMF